MHLSCDVNRGWEEARQAQPNGELGFLHSYVIDPTIYMGYDEGMVVDGTGISTVNKVEPVLLETANVDSSELVPTGPLTKVEEEMPVSPAGVEHARRRRKTAKKFIVDSSHSSECTSPPTRNCRKSASIRLTRKVTDDASDDDDEEPVIDDRRKRR